MDCTNARLLLHFVRTGELDPAERQLLDNHVAHCTECTALAHAESRLDDALETAMGQVPVPAGLKGRILARMATQRQPRRWRWTAAAALVVAAGLGWYAVLGPHELDVTQLSEEIDFRTRSAPDAVEAKFSSEGIVMRAPREFNYELLDTFDTTEIQNRRVPKLTFLARGQSRAALAHVYVLSIQQFKPPAQYEERWVCEIVPASSHNIKILRDQSNPDFFYVVVYTSGTLDPFIVQGI